MIFAIYGPSSVGKTTVSNMVAAELNVPFRSCGRVVRDRALALCADISALPEAVHQEIDQETVAWALAHQPCVVEGRFLNHVLAALDRSVVLIRLSASIAQRQIRACNTGAFGTTIDDLERADAADMRFIDRMFSSAGVIGSCVTVDTSASGVAETALRIKEIILAKLGSLA